MYCVKEIGGGLYWVGGNDRKLHLFESQYPIPRGVSYNAYLQLDEKTVLLDTVDKSISGQFLENVEHVLAGRSLDYLIVNHMEPDHCATVAEVVLRHPEVTLVCNQKTVPMLEQFFGPKVTEKVHLVKEGDTLSTGAHTYAFVMMPMVHWPEAMVSYDTATKTLFSADAFGSFGALGGHLFADQVNFETEWLADARRYFTNIVGKYGAPVQAVLGKAAGLDIQMICPLHGPIWRENLGWLLEKYQRWSTCTPEDQAVVIYYASVYGNTENAAQILAMELAERGVEDVRLYDVSVTHVSDLVAEAFRASHLVFAAPTIDGGVFPAMATLLHHLGAHALHDRTTAFVDNGTWAPTAAKQMAQQVSGWKGMKVLEPAISLNAAVKEGDRAALSALADALAADLKG